MNRIAGGFASGGDVLIAVDLAQILGAACQDCLRRAPQDGCVGGEAADCLSPAGFDRVLIGRAVSGDDLGAVNLAIVFVAAAGENELGAAVVD